MNEEEMMIQDINENCYELYSEEYVEQLQQENRQLKRMLNIKEELDKKGIAYEWEFKDMFDMREENTQLKQQLKDKDEKISELNNLKQHEQNKKLEKIKSYLETTYAEWFNWKNDILEILERK